MSEARERFPDEWGLIEGALAAVDRPALACDADGRVQACNDALVERTAVDAGVAGTDIASVVDCESDLLARTLESGETATGSGTVAVDGAVQPCLVTCRPLGSDGVVGGVVTLDLGEDRDATWSLLAASVGGEGDYAYAIDSAYRVQLFCPGIEREFDVRPEAITGEHISALVDHGIVDEGTVEAVTDRIDTLLETDRTHATFDTRIDCDGRERVLEHRLRAVTHHGETVGAVAVTRDVTERAGATEALRASHGRLSTIVENLPVVVAVVDDDERIEYYRDNGLDTLEYDRREVIGTEIAAFDTEFPEVVECCRRALDGAKLERTVEVGGRTFKVFFEPLGRAGEGDGMVLTGVDITERVENERQLAETNRRLDLALRNTDAGVFEWQIDDDVYWHDSLSELFGLDTDTDYRPASVFHDFIHPDDLERFEEAYDRALEHGEELRFESRIEHPERGIRWHSVEGDVEFEDGEPSRLLGVCRDITERKERERRLLRYEAIIENSQDVAFVLGTDGTVEFVNERIETVMGMPREAVVGRDLSVLVEEGLTDESQLGAFREQVCDVIRGDATERSVELPVRLDGTDAGETVLDVRLTAIEGIDGEARVIGTARDVTERRRRQDQLETLTRIQHLIHESVGALAAATGEVEIKRTVCERLAESPFYEFAWIGERDPSSREVLPDCWAGIAGDYLDEITVTVDPSDSGRGPVGRAYRSGEVAVVSDVDGDPDFAPWREAALERGFRSAAAVPLTHGVATHGVLVVYADRTAAFSELELAAFEVLGGVVGFALSAAQNQRLLRSETVLRLEFLAEHTEPAIADATVEHDCTLVFDGVAGTGDGKSLCYLSVEGADPGDIAPDLEAVDRIERVDRLGGGDGGSDGDGGGDGDGPHFELTVSDSTFQLLADVGARGTRVVVENGHARIVAEAPTDTDVRRIRDALATHYQDVDLVSRQETEPTGAGWTATGNSIDARLTDRQWSVLRAAYYSGYYDWPRETDAETLADSLDIATATTLQHLRKGHHRIMAALFDS